MLRIHSCRFACIRAHSRSNGFESDSAHWHQRREQKETQMSADGTQMAADLHDDLLRALRASA
jgi:hypothetical protein